MNDLLTTTEVCDELGVTRLTVSRWVNATPPRITPVKRGNGPRGVMIFHRADVEAIKAKRTTVTTTRWA